MNFCKHFVSNLLGFLPSAATYTTFIDTDNNLYADPLGSPPADPIGDDADFMIGPHGDPGAPIVLKVPSALFGGDPFSITSELSFTFSGDLVVRLGNSLVATPEPATLMLTGIRLPIAGYLSWRRRKRKACNRNVAA